MGRAVVFHETRLWGYVGSVVIEFCFFNHFDTCNYVL